MRLDGSVEVTHPDGTVKFYPLERLTRLYDSMEQLEDEVWDGEDDGYSDGYDDPLWTLGEDGTWHHTEDDGGDWEDVFDEDAEDNDGDAIDVDPVHGNDLELDESNPTAEEPMTLVPEAPSPSAADLQTTAAATLPPPTSISIPADAEEWSRFEVLPSAPVDHAFYSTPPAQPSRAFLARLQKEYRVLASSLPGSFCNNGF